MAVQKRAAPTFATEDASTQEPDPAVVGEDAGREAAPSATAEAAAEAAATTADPQARAADAEKTTVHAAPVAKATAQEAEPNETAPEETAAADASAPPTPQSEGPTIVQVTPRLEAGGVERGTIEIAEAIALAGGRAIVVSEGGRLEPALEAVGGELVRMPVASKNPLTIRLNGKRLLRLIRERGVDLIHARSRAPAWSAYWAARAAKIPFVTTYHGVYDEKLPMKRFYNSVMARGDLVIAISDHVASLVRDRHGVAHERLVTIPRGADLRAFSEEAATMDRVAALAAEWGVFHEARPILVFPGRLTRWKGQTLFLEAMARVKRARGSNDCVALLVGGAAATPKGRAYRAELDRMVGDLGLEEMVRLVGHCDDMPAAYRLASAVVTASLEPEAFGRTIVEAMAMGAPVVAPAHGGALETVDDEKTGWLFEAGDAESLAMAIEHVLDIGPEGRQAAGAAGVKRARSLYSTTRMQASTITAYQRLLGL